MSPEMEKNIQALCTEYREAPAENRAAILSSITRQATVIILCFAGRVATRALQDKDITTLNLGLVALGLSNFINVDYRDGAASVVELAYVAQLCGLNIVEQAIATIPDLSPKLLNLIKRLTSEPIVMHLQEDSKGNLISWKICKATKSRACPVCHQIKPS
jgi:hypothetical protein